MQSNKDENKSNNKTMAQVQRVQQVKRDFLTKLNFSYSSNFFSNFVSQKNIFFFAEKCPKCTPAFKKHLTQMELIWRQIKLQK